MRPLLDTHALYWHTDGDCKLSTDAQAAIDRHFNQKGDRIVTLRPKNLIITAIDKAFGVGESTSQDKSMLTCKLFRVQPYIPERTQPPEKME